MAGVYGVITVRIVARQIFDAHEGLVVDIDEAVPSLAEDVTFVGPVRGHARLWAEGTRVHLRGEAGVDVLQVCARCLREFVSTVRAQVEEVFDATVRPRWGGALEAEDFVFPLEDELDVTEIFRQHLLLNLPPAPLCQATCQGLCPICGADRNLTRCGCTASSPDPRLSVLERFRVQ